MAGLSGRAIRVAARSHPFRRAGFAFTTEAKEIAVEELGSEPLDVLRRVILIGQEPELVVHLVNEGGEALPLGSAELAELRTVLAELEAQGALDGVMALVEQMSDPGGCFHLRIRSGDAVQMLTEGDLGGYPAYLQPLLEIAMNPAIDAVFVNDAGDEVALDLAKIEAIRATLNQLQTPGGADAETDGAAALSGDAGASGGGANSEPASSITTPAGADSGPAPLTEQARQQAGDDAADRKASTPEGQQPGETVEPPVAGTKKRPRS